jgi:AcrR family transcriptional regulator
MNELLLNNEARRPTQGRAATVPLPGSSTRGERSRQRLLAAARTVFAQCGYEGASTREIVRLADNNIVAIRYHFGDKETLYLETMSSLVQKVGQHFATVCADADVVLREPSVKRERLRQAMMKLLADSLDVALELREVLGPSGNLCWAEADGPLKAQQIAAGKLDELGCLLCELLARITACRADSTEVRLQCMALLSVITFAWRDQVKMQRSLGWRELDQECASKVRDTLRPLLYAMVPC